MSHFFMSFFLLISTTSFASQQEVEKASVQNGVSGIYLCSRDIETLSSVNTEAKAQRVNRLNENCQPRFKEQCFIDGSDFIPFENADDCHYLLRHCFLLHAIGYGELIVDDRKELLLKYIDSLGFGGHPVQSGAAAVYVEDVHKSDIVSCRLVYDETNVTENDLKKFGIASRAGLIRYKWVVATEAMREEVPKGYNFHSRNCCTVAFIAIEKIAEDVKKRINPEEINFGIGVQFVGFSKLALDTYDYSCRKIVKIRFF